MRWRPAMRDAFFIVGGFVGDTRDQGLPNGAPVRRIEASTQVDTPVDTDIY